MAEINIKPLFDELKLIPGIGKVTTDALLRLNCKRIIDLFWHKPYRLIHKIYTEDLLNIESGTEIITKAEIIAIDEASGNFRSRKRVTRIHCRTNNIFFSLVYFNYFPNYLLKSLKIGDKRIISGKLERFNNELQIKHPDYVVEEEKIEKINKIEVIYPLTYAITSKQITNFVNKALSLLPHFPEWLNENTTNKHHWAGFNYSLYRLHHPESEKDLLPNSKHIERLAFDEFLANQLVLKLIRSTNIKSKGIQNKGDNSLIPQLLVNFGFELTESQQKVITEIKHDLENDLRMMRLLQGDVGSGKTAVAVYAAIQVAEAGRQTAIMAPTDILAKQHYAWIEKVTTNLKVNIGILTGKTKTKERKEILRKLAAKEIDILIGTHALFQEDVIFSDLGLVIIDEQHRFGVEQRLSLSQKGDKPDMLLMTATPIPRTLTMTLFGDIDISKIEGKPKGRKKIETKTISTNRIEEIIDSIKRMIDNTRIYWICPLIEEKEIESNEEDYRKDLTAAEKRFKEFDNLFPGKVGLIHGKMKNAERDKVMFDFAEGKISLLIATTVIEVGINVPEATVIVIEHAERFGLAQLHQLRGRVGRSNAQSYCILLYAGFLSKIAKERLDIIRKSEDGFIIAEKDLILRGGGEILGTKQSGIVEFKVANLQFHQHLLFEADKEANEIIALDPKLNSPRGKLLRNLLYLFEHDKHIQYLWGG